MRGAHRHLCEIARGHVRPSDVHTARRRCSSRGAAPEPHEEEEGVLQHQRASEGARHRQRNPASRRSGSVVIAQRRRAEAELMKETVSGPHSESTVLFMNGSGWHAAVMDSGGTHDHSAFGGKSQGSRCVHCVHPSAGGCRAVVNGPEPSAGVWGACVRTVSTATNGNPSYSTETRHDKIMASGLSFKKSCPTLNKTGVIC